jgi:tetratricopeptide (TPR) repeat protein
MSAYLSAITQGSEWDGTGKIKPGKYAIATLLFVLALLAKPSAVVCPLLAAIVACGLMRRSARSAAIELCPWAAVSCVWVLVTSGAQPFNHAVGGPIWLRPLIAGDATAFYLFKLIAPSQSAIDYGRTPADVVTHFWGYLTWLLPAVLGYGLWRVRKPAPWALICAAIFVAALLPVLGFVPFAFQVFSTVADRYAYLAMLGPSLALAIGLACLEITPYARLSWAASVAALILMGLVSAKQTTVWHDSITLFSNTVAINPYSPKVHYDLGTWLLYVNDPADAAQQLHDATVLLPRFSEAHKNLAIALGELNHPAEATAEYSLSLSLAPILPSYQSRTGR